MRILQLKPGTDQYDEALAGRVRAERINDIVAANDSKRYREYLEYCRADLEYCRDRTHGAPPVDPSDEHRASDKRMQLVPRALDAYQRKEGVTLITGRIYVHDDFPICAVPDAVDGIIGLTVHVHLGSKQRSAYDTYREAVLRGVTSAMFRHAQAMMIVTWLEYWLHLHYVEDAEQGLRKLFAHSVEFSKGRAVDLMDSMIMFARRSRPERQRMAG